MNIALVLQHKLLLGIQRLMTSAPGPTVQSQSCVRSQVPPPQVARIPAAGAVSVDAAASSFTKRVMPLRVLRVVEKGQPRSCTGRLVISGRMADVCAELDRLVAREAALH